MKHGAMRQRLFQEHATVQCQATTEGEECPGSQIIKAYGVQGMLHAALAAVVTNREAVVPDVQHLLTGAVQAYLAVLNRKALVSSG
jgi:hypothetical protein